ncbi:MAG: cell division protein ZapB [Acidobacteria bacterium]|nr:cell division protein ZapB [Acidobacteriota bacterium]
MDLKWLEELETKIHDASEEIRRLRQENRELEQRVAQLEGELEAGVDDDGAWQDERQEIRRRVAKLAEDLEELLEQDDDAGSDD